jgi:hypothetical protein
MLMVSNSTWELRGERESLGGVLLKFGCDFSAPMQEQGLLAQLSTIYLSGFYGGTQMSNRYSNIIAWETGSIYKKAPNSKELDSE